MTTTTAPLRAAATEQRLAPASPTKPLPPAAPRIVLPWEEAGQGSRAVKAGAYGPQGSGKTTTMAILGAFIAKQLKKTDAYMIDSEGGADYVAGLFRAQGIKLNVIRTREFKILVEAFETMQTDDVILVDSITHFSDDVTKKFLASKQRKFLTLKDFGPIYDTWRLFSGPYTDSPLNALVCGRMGAVYDSLVNEAGDTEMYKTDSKMKAADQFGHEPDFLLSMEQVVNAKAREQLHKATDKKERSKLASLIARQPARNIVATVIKDRTRLIMGRQYIFTPGGGDAAMVTAVEEAFAPVVGWHHKNDHQATMVTNAGTLFEGSEDKDYYQLRDRRELVLAEIAATFTRWFPNSVGKDVQAKIIVAKDIFGVMSSEAIKQLPLAQLEAAWSATAETPSLLERRCIEERERLDSEGEKKNGRKEAANG